MEFIIFEKLREAFMSSTRADNRFKAAINSIKWEETYTADGENCYIYGCLTFSTPSLDPFAVSFRRPMAVFDDGSVIIF